MNRVSWENCRVARLLSVGLAVLLLLAGCARGDAEPAGSSGGTLASVPGGTPAPGASVRPGTVPGNVPGSGGVSAGGIPAEGISLEVPLLRQADPRWKDVPLGVSGPGIGAEGCALTAFAMVASYYGMPTTPAQANEKLGPYAYPMEWMAGESRYGLHVLRKDCVRFRDSRLHDDDFVRDTIEDCLADGYPVIIGILQTSTGTPHFIVAHGLEKAADGGFDILVRDPSMNSDYDRYRDIPPGWTVTRLVVYQP